MDNNLLNVSSNPHVRSKCNTGSVMLDVIIALIPATIFGVYNFGMKALILILVTVSTAVLAEAVTQLILHKKVTVLDCSAALTGLLLALNLPAEFPIWMAILGSVFAIVVVKQLFGGLGQNFMNPALAARCFLLMSFGTRMTTFVYDGATTATPLYNLKNGIEVSVKSMFLGNEAGTIGETSVIALLIGAAYLVVRKVISLRIPLAYIITFALFVVIFGGHGFDMRFLAAHICGGGLILGAFFMATDYVTSPITPTGRIVYGIILGLLTGIIRIVGPNSEGVSYAIIIGNLLVPIIEKFTVPYAFGRSKERFFGKIKAKILG
ncbi:MAG: RnfABCDGE type electron transport complex subunit D [Lachnospiraceae bacterium]|nr:RnfABCDGE type electron transport complex subunit D [Lachnospiraceae bacterium]